MPRNNICSELEVCMCRPVAFLVLITTFACTQDVIDEGKDDDDIDGKADAWDTVNNPARFEVELNYRLSDLPMNGEAAQIPWPGDYWPNYRDGINYRWRGREHLSPAELYDVAFNNWEPYDGYMDLIPCDGSNDDWSPQYYERNGQLTHEVHRIRGNLMCTNGRDDDSDGHVDELHDYDGIETWWGVCHAWGRASVLEPEPLYPVTYRGLTFYPSDIKALLLTVYDAGPNIMLGGKCSSHSVPRDEHGRVVSPECRDTNAGTFHVVVTNMLGIHRRAFVEDRTGDYEVWNQPVRSYSVLSMRDGLTAEEANAVLGVEGDQYLYNEDAVSFAEVETRLDYITESGPSEEPQLPNVDNYTRNDTYHYVLELDGEGNIIGGEWARESAIAHPDFLTLPQRHGTGIDYITYENVRMLLDMSRQENQGEGVVFQQAVNQEIPDNDPAGLTSILTVDRSGSIQNMQVSLHIEHTFMNDVTVTLRRNDQEVVLIRDLRAPDGVIQERVPVDAFLGEEIGGDWELIVTDNSRSDTGRLWSWSIHAVIVEGGGGPEPQAPLTYESNDAVSIPDGDEAGVGAVIEVGDQGIVRDLRVSVDIAHTYVGDLVVELHHDSLVRRLHNRGGGSADNIVNEFQVPELVGSNLQGEWTLRVSDHASRDMGVLNSWSLTATVE